MQAKFDQRSTLDEHRKIIHTAYQAVQPSGALSPVDDARVTLLIRTLMKISSESFSFADQYFRAVIPSEQMNTKLLDASTQVAFSIEARDSDSIQLWSVYLFDAVNTYLLDLRRAIESKLALAQGNAVDVTEEQVSIYRRDVKAVELLESDLAREDQMNQLRLEVVRAKSSAAEASEAADAAKQAAGVVSESELAKQFEHLSQDHSWAAGCFRSATIAVIALAIIGSFFLHRDGITETPEAIFNIALLSGALGLAGYLGRQAAHHRDLSAWAQSITVQLLTFEAYTKPMQSDSADQIRLSFAARVFGASPESKGESGLPMAPPLIDQLVAALQKYNGSR